MGHHPLNTARFSHACQTGNFEGLIGIFVTGGLDGLQITNSVEFYVADSDHWENVGTLKHARYEHAMSFIDGKVIVAGGYNNGYLQSVETFNGSDWEESYNLSVGRAEHAAVTFPAGMITC